VIGSDYNFTKSLKVSLEKDLQKQVHEEFMNMSVSFYQNVNVRAGIITMQGIGDSSHAEAPDLNP
jgi:hypothetical protein